ncbi:hypothetical protein HW132_22425 [Brasilonema sp. CT11]|nr:hypothetical protein [Brasilonema sp. CT11]
MSFITEVQLTVDSKQEAEFLSRFQVARQLYNACLNEATKRLDLVRNSELYQTGRHLPITKKKEPRSAFKKAANNKREIERRKVAYAKTQNRRVVNKILRHGKHIKTENVLVKGWQKRYGSAISAKSPGFVQSVLLRKAENAGGTVIKFSTQTTALSQTHFDGTRIKKSLSQRVHRDVTGIADHHRDLFSAFLSRSVNQNKLVLQDAQNKYLGLEPILLEAYQRYLKLRLAPSGLAEGLTREQVSTSESRQSDYPSEWVSNKLLTTDQIANKVSPPLLVGEPVRCGGQCRGRVSRLEAPVR